MLDMLKVQGGGVVDRLEEMERFVGSLAHLGVVDGDERKRRVTGKK